MRLEPATPRSRVKHSTSEPLQGNLQKLSSAFKTFVLPIFEWPLKTGLSVFQTVLPVPVASWLSPTSLPQFTIKTTKRPIYPILRVPRDKAKILIETFKTKQREGSDILKNSIGF